MSWSMSPLLNRPVVKLYKPCSHLRERVFQVKLQQVQTVVWVFGRMPLNKFHNLQQRVSHDLRLDG